MYLNFTTLLKCFKTTKNKVLFLQYGSFYSLVFSNKVLFQLISHPQEIFIILILKLLSVYLVNTLMVKQD